MKVLFIESKKKLKKDEVLNVENIKKKLSKEVHILYTIQYKNIAEKIKKQLGNRVIAFNQIIGCSKVNPKGTLLLIGSGRFHALNLALTTNKEIYVYESGKIKKITEQEIKKLRRREKGKLSRFLSSGKIGLLISIKPGQNNLDKAKKFKKKLENRFPEKSFYVFLVDTINIQELENFSVDFWINFACPGLQFDSEKLMNYEKIVSFLNIKNKK